MLILFRACGRYGEGVWGVGLGESLVWFRFCFDVRGDYGYVIVVFRFGFLFVCKGGFVSFMSGDRFLGS